ncbi:MULTISPECIES: vWA domain-containing protein [Kitasatospora]|uniref:VWA domain-containing protein n=1 Tax=Kitasatospora cathayae TaxID=3004092 RepID=A0ABY7Q8Z1_9ACTN|nr:VWA domain-containing protein [Kitasatospora sp. HUAS 3-15]WBP89036.1 VWA domain-containing protein [Kitasatospora sp. HUAS 3-15]
MSLCLPTYVVIDASSSMKPHEAVLNATLSRLHYNLATNPRVSEFARVSVVAFSTDVHVVIPMSDMEQVPSMPEVICGGRTDYGKTFDRLRECIEQDVSSLRAQHYSVLRPTVFFLTDGGPTDAGWRKSFRELVDRSRPRYPHVIAYGFGDAERGVLQEVATKALFIADGTDTESALSGAISGLLNTLIASSQTGQMQIATDVKGFEYVQVAQEYVD